MTHMWLRGPRGAVASGDTGAFPNASHAINAEYPNGIAAVLGRFIGSYQQKSAEARSFQGAGVVGARLSFRPGAGPAPA